MPAPNFLTSTLAALSGGLLALTISSTAISYAERRQLSQIGSQNGQPHYDFQLDGKSYALGSPERSGEYLHFPIGIWARWWTGHDEMGGAGQEGGRQARIKEQKADDSAIELRCCEDV